MSAAARKWLSRLHVKGAAVNLVLGVLADAADKQGRVNLSQAVIAQRAGVSEVTTRRTLSVLQQSNIIRREHRSAGGKTGRIADLIFLNMEVSAMVQPVKMIGNDRSATDQFDRLQSVVQPIRMIVAPTKNDDPKNTTESTPHARADVDTPFPDRNQPRTSGRVWQEKLRGAWRCRVRHDGVDLDLGRFPTEAEAARALRDALADIEHASRHPAGTPRTPTVNPSALPVDGRPLADFLFGPDPRAGGRPEGRPDRGETMPQPSSLYDQGQSPNTALDVPAGPDDAGPLASPADNDAPRSYAEMTRGW